MAGQFGYPDGWGFQQPPQQAPSVEAIQAENLQLREQLQQARSQNHNLHNTNQNQQNAFQQHLTGGNQENDLLNFSWGEAQQKLGLVPQQPSQVPTNKSGTALTFKSQEDFDNAVNSRIQAHRQQEVQLTTMAQTAEQQLMQKFVAEHPDLIPHATLIKRLWGEAQRLNPNTPALERYNGVIGLAKGIVAGYTTPQKQNGGAQMPYGSLTPNSIPPGQNPLAPQYGQQQQQNAGDDYNAEEHLSELAERRKWVESKMFS